MNNERDNKEELKYLKRISDNVAFMFYVVVIGMVLSLAGFALTQIQNPF